MYFIYQKYINTTKQRASFTRSTKTNRNEQLCLQNEHKQTKAKSFVYKNNINKKKQIALFTKPI